MTENDKNAFAQIMYGLADNFSATITPEGMRFRFDCLSGYDLDQIKKASLYIVKTRKFTKMPTVAEFLEAIEGNESDRAEEQAMKVIEAVRMIGSYGSPVFEDPKTQRVVTVLGWNNICHTEETKIKFFVKDFIDAYQAESRRQSTVMISGSVPGDVRQLLSGIGSSIKKAS